MANDIKTYSVPDCNMSYDEHDICPNGTHTHPPCNPNVTEGAPYYDCTPIMAYHEYETIIGIFEKYCDWDVVSSHPLPNEFIKKYHDRINWEKLLQARPFTESELHTYRKYVPIDVWGRILPRYQHLSEEFIYNDRYILDWVAVSQYQKLSPTFIRKMKDYVDWTFVSRYQTLTHDILEEFADRVAWLYISMYQKLHEHFIEKFADKVNWMAICEYQDISEEFISEHADRINWKTISTHRELSDEFIINNLDKLYLAQVVRKNTLSGETMEAILAHPRCDEETIDAIVITQQPTSEFIEQSIIPRFTETYDAWAWISAFPSLTEDFIDTYADKLDWEKISRCQKLSEKFIEDHIDLVHWDEIVKHQVLSPEFIIAHKNKT